VFRKAPPVRSLAIMTSARTVADFPEGTIAIVMGATRGIGAATARAFARAGASVVLAARTEDELTVIADQISQEGCRAFVRHEVRNPPGRAAWDRAKVLPAGHLQEFLTDAAQARAKACSPRGACRQACATPFGSPHSATVTRRS
jgi:NAD(P)-dependent dehydrogenase (short-subunit alcohol dehydrogenase family)